MYKSNDFKQTDEETFKLTIHNERPYKILQLTDLHLGFGILSGKKDALALNAVTSIVKKAAPDLIVLTGDSVFPFLPKAGTMNNRKQARRFIAFMDSFQIPYAIVMGNHDAEMGAKCNKEELMKEFQKGQYSICCAGKNELTGVGNYFINLMGESGKIKLTLCMLDSNMYGDGWFYSGFDCIHEDQTEWCMNRLNQLKGNNPDMQALAFFHMPPGEFKEAYEKMKLGDESVRYHFGSISEPDDYFGISNRKGTFFTQAVKNGVIKGMFCGHDHLNTLSLTYQGIRLTYGMSIDYLGYKGIDKKYTQRGGTLITCQSDGMIDVKPVPFGSVVSTRVRGEKTS